MHTDVVSLIGKGPAPLVWGQQLPTPHSESGAILGEVGRGLLGGRPRAPDWPQPPQDSASSLGQPHPAEPWSLLLRAWPASGVQPGMFLSIQANHTLPTSSPTVPVPAGHRHPRDLLWLPGARKGGGITLSLL